MNMNNKKAPVENNHLQWVRLVQWNTGARYTEEGQVIVAGTRGDRCYFHDLSRMIYGSFEYSDVRFDGLDEYQFKEHVMHMYNYHQFRGESSSMIPMRINMDT